MVDNNWEIIIMDPSAEYDGKTIKANDLEVNILQQYDAFLKKEGHDVDLFFLTREFRERFEEKTMNDLLKLTKNSDLVGISLMSNFWDNAIQITRKISQELRPSILDNLGLISAIEWLQNQYAERSNLNFSLKILLNKLVI